MSNNIKHLRGALAEITPKILNEHKELKEKVLAFIREDWNKPECKEDFKKAQEVLFDFFKFYGLEGYLGDIVKEMNSYQPEKEKDDKIKVMTSFHEFEDGTLIEQVYSKGKNQFCIYNSITGIIYYADNFEDEEKVYYPLIGEEIEKKAIFLPSKAEEYDEHLDTDIAKFIHKWLDVPKEIERFGVWNIKRSWVFERFHTLNYLRALGDTGQGKSRFLDVFGILHYKPIFTSGATTPAPIFRIIDKWRGTMVFDEADLSKSDESQAIIKIINSGYEKGKSIMRCDQNDANIINFFDPYCPKIIATRKSFDDKAVESRCITHVMLGTLRRDIKWNLDNNFYTEAEILRNKLLMWRFKNYFLINQPQEGKIDFGELEPRVTQIINAFGNLFYHNDEELEEFKAFIQQYQESLIQERQNSWDGEIVLAIHDLVKQGKTDISAQDIIEVGEFVGFHGEPLKPRGLNSSLKSLGFDKTKLVRIGIKVKRILPLNPQVLESLFKRYGCNDVTIVTHVTESPETQKTLKNEVCNGLDPLSIGVVTTVTPLQMSQDFTTQSLSSILMERPHQTMPISRALSLGFPEEIIKKAKEEGLIFEPKLGLLKLI